MKKNVLTQFNRIEAQRHELLTLYDRFTSEQLRFKPGAGKWNLLQVVRHLVTAEKQSFSYIKRKLKIYNQIPKAGIGSDIRFKILHAAFLLPLKYKAPKIAEVSEDYPDFESMKAEWDEIRSDLNRFIEQTDGAVLAKELYNHPRAGRMNVRQALRFMEIHTAHHFKQIGRITNHPSFPAAQ